MNGRRWLPWALAAVLAAGFGLRLWMASADLTSQRHFDERYSFHNVRALLVEGTLRPANVYYPSLSWLPQALVLGTSEGLARLTGAEALSVFADHTADGFSPTAYLLARSVSAFWGTLTLWLLFRLGRRLFDERVGLLAAVLLAVFPAHLASSALFKPDVLVALAAVVAFHLALDALAADRLRSYLAAGAAVGLAVAAKYTGVGAALPLAAGALAEGGWRRWRRWRLLLAAGAASVAVFFLLNPYLAEVFAYLPRLWHIMEAKGEEAGGSRLAVVVAEGAYLVRHHGTVVTGFALVGLVGLVPWALGRGPSGERRRGAVLLLAAIVGYSLLYAAATALFKGQNYLPVAPFTSLAAAWAMLLLWRRLQLEVPQAVRRGASFTFWTVACLLLFLRPAEVAYRQAVPSTYERAQRQIVAELRPARLRYLYYEKQETPLRLSGGGHRLLAIPVESLEQVPPEELALADAELFFARRLEGPASDGYFRRLAGVSDPRRARRLEPGWLTAHGPALVLLFHGWERWGEGLGLEAGGGAETQPGAAGGKGGATTGGAETSGVAVEEDGGQTTPGPAVGEGEGAADAAGALGKGAARSQASGGSGEAQARSGAAGDRGGSARGRWGRSAPGGLAFTVRLQPPVAAGEAVSLSFWLPRRWEGGRPRRLSVGGVELPLWATLTSGRRVHYLTPRTLLTAGTSQVEVRLLASTRPELPPEGELHRWRRAVAAPAVPGAAIPAAPAAASPTGAPAGPPAVAPEATHPVAPPASPAPPPVAAPLR